MIKAIIFDMAGVIFSKALSGLVDYIHLKTGDSPDKILSELKKEEFSAFLYGKITEDVYLNRIIERTGWKFNIEKAKKFERESMKPVKGTLGIIKDLKEKGYKLYILSGHTKEWTEYLDEVYGYKNLFKKTFFSFQVGYNKPDPRIYNDLLNCIKISPEECLFIDDNENFLDPAEKLGMKTIHFKDAETLKMSLKEIRIRV